MSISTISLASNANDDRLAHHLQKGKVGTFSSLITTKKGKVKGGVRYGDDTVKVVVFTGFKYERLVARSLELMDDIDLDALVTKAGGAFTKADAELALAEQRASFERTLDPAQESTATTAHVYEPLTVKQVELNANGQPVMEGGKVKETEVLVPGHRVYKCVADTGRKCHCRACTGDPKAPLDDTIYLQGLRIYSEVLEVAENGPAPKPNSRPKTLAKNAIRRLLPISRYVSYALEPGTDFILKVGGTARFNADSNGYSAEKVA